MLKSPSFYRTLRSTSLFGTTPHSSFEEDRIIIDSRFEKVTKTMKMVFVSLSSGSCLCGIFHSKVVCIFLYEPEYVLNFKN